MKWAAFLMLKAASDNSLMFRAHLVVLLVLSGTIPEALHFTGVAELESLASAAVGF